MATAHSAQSTLPDGVEPMSVSALTARIKGTLEEEIPAVWVTGEVSNFSRPQSGHCYLTLKDDHAQVRAVVWRGSAAKMRFELRDGLQLVCHGRLDVYPPRGSYQLVIDRAHPAGEGALELALRQLREKLGAEGLFDPQRKRPLPRFPKRIGFVTSPTGAAVRDFLQVLDRRWRGSRVMIVPTRVQGEGAADEIAAAIKMANRIQPGLDVLVVGRGGGSLEDLWAFNEEAVVRALAASRVPTISAVGHEIDVTLSDFAADVRALTPSEAAERAVPSAEELGSRLSTLDRRLHQTLLRRLGLARERIERLASRRPFARPHALYEAHARRLDELGSGATRSVRRLLRDQSARLASLSGKLESLSPLAVLGRGYSLTQDARGAIVRTSAGLTSGDTLTVRFARGSADCTVQRAHDPSEEH